MIKKIMLMLLSLSLFLLAAGCGPSASEPQITDNGAGSNGGDLKLAVTIRDYKFNPEKLEIKKGDTVTWINEDNIIHTATGKTFDSGNLKRGEKFSFTFNDAGVFDYICTPHPFMKASVTVK